MKKRYFYHISITIVIIALISWAISCAVNPVTKKREFVLLSEADEIALGKQTDAQVLQMYGKYESPALDSYVNSIGQNLAKSSHRPHLKWDFKVLDSPVINAFAVPGGYIYLTRGILAYLNNEAELAGVVGHEIGHVTARHSVQQYTRAAGTQLLLGVGSAMSETFRKYAGVAQFGVSMLFLKYSRDDERQADQLGVEYSAKGGYDATHMANFFVTLERMQPSEDGGGLPEWFSTHPNPTDRVKSIQSDAQQWKTKLAKTKYMVDKNEYLQKINGVVYGPDPRQGYVEGTIFYHPTLKFQFPVPAQWELNNAPTQVQMYTKQQDAIMIFTLTEATSPSVAADKFVSESQATVISSDRTSVNGLTAHRLNTEITSEQTKIKIQSYFIQLDNQVFVFHGYTTSDQFSGYSGQFSQTMTQFKRLTDPAKINVKPTRLGIKKTTKQTTLRSALQSFNAPTDKLEELAIMNGMKLNDTVPAGTLLKVLAK